ncbi:hypothetical protein LMG26411_01204 [Cupriavidus numazuensis]|uniref:Helix-turn-helix domain-containing protein n=1 Tax=Cupriavidus numazuensis TaxID=221992 RepID=A0ABN7PWW3_9BURK|nr:helix-turn-helix domain-containing protein [Cupriavidus numazuensis]CAG2136160.1 hypothetical protein LMG26411_01204 [Cupriavidus numazuensis]
MIPNHPGPALPAIPPGLAAIANGRDFLPTGEAARVLNRAPQTLRLWASAGGPIKPIRINSRLAWAVSDIATVLRGGGEG